MVDHLSTPDKLHEMRKKLSNMIQVNKESEAQQELKQTLIPHPSTGKKVLRVSTPGKLHSGSDEEDTEVSHIDNGYPKPFKSPLAGPSLASPGAVGSRLTREINLDDDYNNSPHEGHNTSTSHGEGELFGLTDESSRYDQIMILMQQAVPVIISFFLSIGGTFINLVFAGQFVHESGDQSAVFAGVSLANMFANVSCLSLLIGMSSAVETLGSQHNGAGNYKEVGIVLLRSCLILGVMCVPIVFLWFFVADIFKALGVEAVVCDVIERFIRIRILTIPMDVINESYEKYLMSIGVMKPSMWANISFNVFILLFNLLFVYGLRLHYDCLAWSWVLSLYLSAFVQIYLSISDPAVKRTLVLYDKEAWNKWGEFIRLGFPGTVMLCSEWWAYEILAIFASMLGTAQVAAQTIILQTASLAFMIPLGLGVACSSLVGNAIGAGMVPLAKDIGKLSIKTIVVLEVFIGISIVFLGRFFVDLFSNDPRVIQVANRAVPFLSAFAMIDGLQGVCSGVLRGAGKQFIGAVANIIAFYGIGLPMAWFFCFTLHLGVNGLMLGIAFGTMFQVTVLVVMILFFESYLYSTDLPLSQTNEGFQPVKLDEDEVSQHGGIAMNPLNSAKFSIEDDNDTHNNKENHPHNL